MEDFNRFLTYHGHSIDINNMKEDDINVNDIFHALSMINRFTGHSRVPFSVAEHSCYCYLIAQMLGYGPRIQAFALMHDASEAYVNDLPTYVKVLLPEYKEIENKVEKIIFSKLGLGEMTPDEKTLIKKIDNTIILIEMRDLTRHDISKMDLADRDNFYEEVKFKIDLEFGNIKSLLEPEFYPTVSESNYQRKFENLMKHIYKTKIAGGGISWKNWEN